MSRYTFSLFFSHIHTSLTLSYFLHLYLQCVLPAGVEFYASGFDSNDASTFPRSYPIVLTGKQVSVLDNNDVLFF